MTEHKVHFCICQLFLNGNIFTFRFSHEFSSIIFPENQSTSYAYFENNILYWLMENFSFITDNSQFGFILRDGDECDMFAVVRGNTQTKFD